MKRESRRRLQEADPNLTIISGRRSSAPKAVIRAVPRVLSPEEAKQWGLPEMIPIFPAEEIIVVEGRWSKKQLQEIATQHFLEAKGDKQALVEKLMYIGALDSAGTLTDLSESGSAPYIMSNPKHFCCRVCQTCCPEGLLGSGQFLTRMCWLREHYKVAHPGVWVTGASVPQVSSKFPLGQLVMTRGVADRVATDAAFAAFALACLKRHANGDWGDLGEDDKKENEYSLDKHLRLFSAYDKYPMPKIWIITEADRSVTTTLFPDEY